MDKISGRIWTIIGIVLLIISGIFTSGRCISYIKDISLERGTVGELQVDKYIEPKDNYSITYNLDGGLLEIANPNEYNLFTETFTLNNPTKQGYEFLGWTNETITEPTFVVTIKQGSAGDIEFTANYLKNLDEPIAELNVTSNGVKITWSAVDKATSYIVNINGKDYLAYKNSLSYTCSSSQLIVGENTFKVKALCETLDKTIVGPYSNTLTYAISETLESPILSISNNEISFNTVDGAQCYEFIIGNEKIFMSSQYGTLNNGVWTVPIYSTTDSTIESCFYSQSNLEFYNSNSHSVEVTVKAVSYSNMVASAISNTINFEYPEFDKFNSLSIQSNYQTVDMIADTGLVLDNNQYLCLLLSSSAGNLFDNNKYLSRYGFTVEISSNDEVVQTSLLKIGVHGVFYTRLNDLENLELYKVTLKFTNYYYDNYFVEFFETFYFVLNTSQVWCLSF